MNKQEKIIVAILAIALVGSLYVSNIDAKQRAEYQRQQQLEQESVRAEARRVEQEAAAAASTNHVDATNAQPVLLAAAELPDPTVPEMPEQTFALSNAVSVVTLTSHGGGIKSVRLLNFDLTGDPADGKVELDFSTSPSLTLEGLQGFGVKGDFAVVVAEDGQSAVLTASDEAGLVLERRVAMTNGYVLAVSDTFRNEAGAAREVPSYRIALGPMRELSRTRDDSVLAVDAQVSERGKTPVIEITKSTKGLGFASMFNAAGGGCRASTGSSAGALPAASMRAGEVFWASARERFFLQVLTPSVPATGLEVRAVRDASALSGAFVLQSVSSALNQPEAMMQAGGVFQRNYALYVGPRQMSELRSLGSDYTQIMRFGTWSFFCRALLDLLNFLYGLVPNYGVAIVLLTGLVRLVLYPINKRNAASMRKMQEIQPLVKEVQAKYKNDPKKLQAETMRIYGENKVNPLSSCLPMLIQLPVFIALFTVLRSAVELRFEPFLWIADLSEPENLFRDIFGFGVNFLPIAMAATMALQTYLTPTAGDPSQQRMMMVMMPIMMLVICYPFPSALGLYWTVSQVLAIIALLRTRMKNKKKEAGASAGAESGSLRETRQMRREKARNI